MNDIQILREETGTYFNLAKRALMECRGNYEAAKEYIYVFERNGNVCNVLDKYGIISEEEERLRNIEARLDRLES